MFGAGAAGFFEPSPQLLPRPMAAHLQVVAGDAEACGDGLRVFIAQLQRLDERGIVRLHRRQQRLETPADDGVRLGLDCRVVFLGQHRLVSGFDAPAAIEVREGVVKNAIEPGQHLLFVAQRRSGFEGFEQALLNDIRRQIRIAGLFAA